MDSVAAVGGLVLALFDPRAAVSSPGAPIALKVDAAPPTTAATFQQRISHADPSLGNFSQKYVYNTQFYKGPGSPVLLYTPGEIASAGYEGFISDRSLLGLYAKTIGAAMILLEHRYWGDSSPYQTLDTKALQHLTLENSVQDLVYFARNVRLPFDTTGATNAPKAPWINVGGSYSGALSAWVAKLAPGTFWAYHSTSGPVQAIYDYWSYFVPIQEGMAKNCSADFTRIADHVDEVIRGGNKTEIFELQKQFGLEGCLIPMTLPVLSAMLSGSGSP